MIGMLKYGRDLRENDINYSTNVCLIFQPIVEKLFPNINPIGQTIRVDGKTIQSSWSY